MPSDPKPIIEKLYTTDDFTFFRWDPAKDIEAWLLADDKKRPNWRPSGRPALKDYEIKLRLYDETAKVEIGGRALVCRVQGEKGDGWSITVRRTSVLSTEDEGKLKPVPNPGVSPAAYSRWAPEDGGDARFLNSQKEVVSLVTDRIEFPAPARGLLAIFGATSSGKNWIARALIHGYLTNAAVNDYYINVKKRRPHLLTFEDPVEKAFWPAGQDQDGGLDYTPREKLHSAESLTQALESALRQTPAAYYAGETRSLTDWRRLLAFAGTGHFVITTGHAGSLTEAMGTLLSALRAESPARRKDVAERLIAVVHLRTERIRVDPARGSKPVHATVTLPAVWLATERAQHALMAQGRGSILPEDYCHGRQVFAKDLLQVAGHKVRENRKARFLRDALQMDLKGI